MERFRSLLHEENGIFLSRKETRDVLATIPSYTQFVVRHKNGLRRHYNVTHLFELFHADLFFLKRSQNYIGGLLVVDAFSRRIFVAPITFPCIGINNFVISTINGFRR